MLEEKEMYEQGNRDAAKETALTAESNVKKVLKRQVFKKMITLSTLLNWKFIHIIGMMIEMRLTT